MFHSSLPMIYCLYTFRTTIYNLNILLHSHILSCKSPYELLYKRVFYYSFLRVFGFKCFPCLRSYNVHKLQTRFVSCTFLGYSSKHHGYLCLNPIMEGFKPIGMSPFMRSIFSLLTLLHNLLVTLLCLIFFFIFPITIIPSTLIVS